MSASVVVFEDFHARAKEDEAQKAQKLAKRMTEAFAQMGQDASVRIEDDELMALHSARRLFCVGTGGVEPYLVADASEGGLVINFRSVA